MLVQLRNIAVILALFGAATWWGIYIIRKDSGKKEIACFSFLMLWSAYMLVASKLHWPAINTAELREIIYSPVGNMMEKLIFKKSP